LVVGVVAATAWVVYCRATYHTLAWWAPPERLRYCGRNYLIEEHNRVMPRDGHETAVFRTGLWNWQVYKQTWGSTADNRECPVSLNLVRNAHEVDGYALSGSP
jgi:hypothetical protein